MFKDLNHEAKAMAGDPTWAGLLFHSQLFPLVKALAMFDIC